MVLVWIVMVVVGSVAFMSVALRLGHVVAVWTGLQVARALFLPVSLILGMIGWLVVLIAASQLRRSYLRKVGTSTTAVVVESDLRYKNRPGRFGQWELRVKAQLAHPTSGADVHVVKRFLYHDFCKTRAQKLAERLSVGSASPVVVHKNSAQFEVSKRPVWIDAW
ncbi:hypothetical protein GCM10023318_38980 [Nocardia callitridis]|uniref:Uncharacterized protein n=2 Tax=Nocardia callitridis TaxID=648753 RepID=A0ABP9KHE5_9NOCA